MITFKQGDIFQSGCEALVNPVNCVGVSGRGLAKQFARNFPKEQSRYEADCHAREMKVGRVRVYDRPWFAGVPKYIIAFPTKQHWSKPSQIEWIHNGLVDTVRFIAILDIRSIAIPALGCGNGGLQWDTVKEAMELHLHRIDRDIQIYEPTETC